MKVYQELDDVTILTLDQIPELKTKEPFNNQYRNLKTEDAKKYPAAYFELIEPINWDDASNEWQTARVRARIHVVVFDVKRDKAALHDIGQKVFKKLNGLALMDTTNTYCLTSNWTRVSSSIPKRYNQVKVMTIDFEFEAFDGSSMNSLTTQTISINIP